MHLVKPIIASAGLTLVLTLGFLSLVSSCGGWSAQTGLGNGGSGWVDLHPKEYRDAVLSAHKRADIILTLYRDGQSKEEVVSFFEAILHSRELAEYILSYSSEFEISPSLALALSWAESRFDPTAINRNKASIDRGLFQLNSRSFPKLTEAEFFNPKLNTRYGIAHLRWCLDMAGSEVAALAMYNAGTTRVRQDTTPKRTLTYISRIQDFRDGVDDLFRTQVEPRWRIADGRVSPVDQENSMGGRLAAVRFPLFNAFR